MWPPSEGSLGVGVRATDHDKALPEAGHLPSVTKFTVGVAHLPCGRRRVWSSGGGAKDMSVLVLLQSLG